MEGTTLEEATQALALQTKGTVRNVKRVHGQMDRGFDATFELHLNSQTILFVVEVKNNVDRRPALAQIKAQLDQTIHDRWPGYLPMLAAPYMTETMAEECRRLNLPFADTAGNLFIRTEYALLFIVGRPKPEHLGRKAYQAVTPTGMRIIFALLCKPKLVGETYRQIGQVAQVALGAVGPVLKDLETRGFLYQRKGATTLERREELLHEWVVQYPAILRPKLNARRYTAVRERILDLNLQAPDAYWGGEVAAERMTGYLKPEQILIYTRTPPKHLLIEGRMRLAPQGETEILDAFWAPETDQTDQDLAPALLVYADLMMTNDTRNLETAKMIYERYLNATIPTV